MKHETSKHNQMQASKSSRNPLIIAHQPSKTRGPGKRAHYDPSPRQQQNKADFGFGQFDDYQLNVVFLSLSRRYIADIALIHEGDFDCW